MLDKNTLMKECIEISRDVMIVIPVMTAEDFAGCVVPFVRPPDPEDAKFTTREDAAPEARLREMLGVQNDNERGAA